MELSTDDYILGYWIASDKDGNDWYCMVKKTIDGEWYGEYTFRYNNANSIDPFDDKDEKSRTCFSPPPTETEEEVLTKIDVVFQAVKLKYSRFSDHFLVRGNFAKFTEIAKTKDYMHMKTVN